MEGSLRRRAATKGRPGFTMIEAMVALVIFGIITTAIGFAMSVALEAQRASQSRQDDAGEVRAVFDALRQDIPGAYASANDPASMFVTGSDYGASNDLLTLSTQIPRLQAYDLGLSSAGNVNAMGATPMGSQQTVPPQTACMLVRYVFDPQAQTLSRLVLPVPDPTVLLQQQPGPDDIIARHVVSVQLSFWDATQNQSRNDWDYAHPSTSQAGASTSQSLSTGSDTYLPSAVDVTVTTLLSDGSQHTMETMIPIVAPQPQKTPSGTQTTTGSGTGGATGGTGGNSGGTGGGSGGGTGGKG
ncbi:MAG TPA: prepilin-type N-terminal cleavage/methylation domain-containing protein [Chthonomonadaceae bacterium]|nr:prepilin-type N-terminal cleavage/methylation domain-containing protein [Chthonomonadaceae bacterium]